MVMGHGNPGMECRYWIEAYRAKQNSTVSSFAWRTRLDNGARPTRINKGVKWLQGNGALANLGEQWKK
jgi:hypothetical protein